jgi:23S rRNA pseudouridine1911/1915/1917 synthase
MKCKIQNSKFKIIYEDEDILVIDKPAGIDSDSFENRIHRLLEYQRRAKMNKIHRLDKDTSGILLIAKNNKALEFFQKQFQERKVEKKYIALVTGEIKNEKGVIQTLIGRSPKDRKKQKVYFSHEPDSKGKREAITEYRVLQKFKNYTLLEVNIKTGRKHQIRTHFAYLGHPIVGDKMYGFKNQDCPEELKRQFLHASYLKIKMPDGTIKEFKSKLPEELKLCQQKLKIL